MQLFPWACHLEGMYRKLLQGVMSKEWGTLRKNRPTRATFKETVENYI